MLNLCSLEEEAVLAPHVAPVVLLFLQTNGEYIMIMNYICVQKSIYDDELCAYLLHGKEIRSYLYTCFQRNSVLFIYMFSKKFGPIYIHVFNEIRSYLYTRVQRS